jgi:ribosome biogenesis GTPase
MKGLIASNIAGTYKVYSDGVFYSCSIKKTLKSNRLVAVGDKVIFNEISSVIEDIEEPKNTLVRPAVNNIDLALVVSSIEEPEFSPYLILKFLTYFAYHNIPACLILSKSDLVQNNGKLQAFLNEFSKTHIKCFIINNKDPLTILPIKDVIRGKVVVFCGQSGVGKSTLINMIEPNFNRLVDNYSIALNRGKHKTKENIILPLLDDTYLVDTPGFSSLDLEMGKIAIRDNFPLISNYLNKCKYDNCLHIDEPNCAVKEAVKIEEISIDWYNIYVELIKDVK